MKTRRLTTILILNLLIVLTLGGYASGAEVMGSVVSLQGAVSIERDGKLITPSVKSDILLKDVVSTSGASSIKMQFSDGSSLTLGESTTIVIKDFITNNNERSLFDLLQGRAHVVTATGNFRVRTPSAIVATQKGTCVVVEACARNQERCVRVIEGNVDICDTGLAGCKPLPPGTTGDGLVGAGKTPGTGSGKEGPAGPDVCWGDYCAYGGSGTPTEPAGTCTTCPGGPPPISPVRTVGIIDLIWP